MRYEKLDILRGIAIVLMVIYHINYSLLRIFDNSILNFSDNFWFILGFFSATLFIFVSGFSFSLAEQKYGDKIINKYIKISFFLGVLALMISLVTFSFINDQYIRFGIIHFFSVSFLLMLVFRKFKYYNFLYGFIIIVYGFYFIPVIESQYFYFLGFTYVGFRSADFYSIFPYFGVMLLGYSFALFLNNINKLDVFKLKGKKYFILRMFEYFGKRSLIIYLIHQPIIIGTLYLFYKYSLIL